MAVHGLPWPSLGGLLSQAGELGTAYVEIFFKGFLERRELSIRERLGVFDKINHDESGDASEAELKRRCADGLLIC